MAAPKAYGSAGPRASSAIGGRHWATGLKPLATIDLGGAIYYFYVALGALILNVAVVAVVTRVVVWVSPAPQSGAIARS